MTMLESGAPQKPYNCMATFVSDAAMNRDDNGVEYLTGFSKSLGTDVTCHYRKANHQTGRDGAYLVQWMEKPFGMTRRHNRIFPNILEAELFLRADDEDLAWIDQLNGETLSLVAKTLNDNQSALSADDRLMADDLAALYSRESRNLSPDRFKVPYTYRNALSALFMSAASGYPQITDEDAKLLAKIKDRIDLDQQIDLDGFRPFP
jgi:hypothetical protein